MRTKRQNYQPRPWLFILFVLAAVISLCAIPVAAQSTATGNLAGVVTDPSGAVVPGATVTLTDVATNTPLTTATTDTGRYIFTTVPPGTYDLSIIKTGFANARYSGQTVKVGSTTTVNASLRVGTPSEVVEVQATGFELQTMNATIGNTVTRDALDSLPGLNYSN